MSALLERSRLWSLWDMASNYAWQFYIISDFVNDMQRALGHPGVPLLMPSGEGGLGSIFARANNEWLNDGEQIRSFVISI